MSSPEREQDERTEGGQIVPFPRSVPDEVVDAELVDDGRVFQPGEPVELARRDPAELMTRTVAGAPLPAPWERPADVRPVIPGWLFDRDARRAAERHYLHRVAHDVAFHAVRGPLYAGRVGGRALIGAGRVVRLVTVWALDLENSTARMEALRQADTVMYHRLTEDHDRHVKPRLIVLGVTAVGLTVGGAVLWMLASLWVQLAVLVTVLTGLAIVGRRPDRPILQPASLTSSVVTLSPDIVLRAFVAAKLCTEDSRIGFATPIHREALGWRVVIDLPYGVSASKALARREDIASGLDVDERQLFLSRVRGQSGSARRVDLWVADTDPLSVPAGRSPLIDARKVNFWSPWPFGVDERGRTVELCLLWAAMLVGAIPRQGKTFVARLVALAAALDPHVQIRVHDLKGGPDWMPFRHVAHRFFLGDRTDPETGVDPVLALLDSARELLTEVDRRNRTLRSMPAAVCPEGKLTEELSRTKAADLPLILVVIDEVQRAFLHKTHGEELAEVLTDLAKVGPSAGIMLLAATQKPDSKSTPTGFRDQLGVKFALRVTTRDASEAVLGAGAYGEGLDASKLSPEAKGCGLLRGTGDSGGYTGNATVRTYFADGADAEAICLRGRALREAADTLTGMAVDGAEVTATPPAYSAAADALTVLGSDDQAHSDVICSRLAERWPDRYAGWEPAQLAAALKPHRVETGQVWATGLDGAKANRRGVKRADLLAALDGPKGGA